MIVTGKVFNDTDGFMPNVNVSHVLPVKNGNYPIVKTVQTDNFGGFKIDVPSNASLLQFSHIGFDYDTITAGEFNAQKLKQFQLYPSSNLIPEVTVNLPIKQNPVAAKKDYAGYIALALFAVAAGVALYLGRDKKNKSVKARA